MNKLVINNVRREMDWSNIKMETIFDFFLTVEAPGGRTEYSGTAKEGEDIILEEEKI